MPLSCSQSARFVPRDCGAHDERIDGVGFTNGEDLGCCSAREKAFGIDWRVYLVFLTHSSRCGSPGRVRWILPDHRP